MTGGKGSKAHFVWRCGLCAQSANVPSNAANRSCTSLGKRESSAKFESAAITPYKSENAQFEPLVVIECRGLEFTGFDPRVHCSIYHCTTNVSSRDSRVSGNVLARKGQCFQRQN